MGESIIVRGVADGINLDSIVFEGADITSVAIPQSFLGDRLHQIFPHAYTNIDTLRIIGHRHILGYRALIDSNENPRLPNLKQCLLQSIVELSEKSFFKYRQLEAVDLGVDCYEIGFAAFCGCTSLTTIRIGTPRQDEIVLLAGAFVGIGLKEIHFAAIGLNTELGEVFSAYNRETDGQVEYLPDGYLPPLEKVYVASLANWCSNYYFTDKESNPCYLARNIYIEDAENPISRITPTNLQGASGIGDFAFVNCEDLEYVNPPGTVYGIGKEAFSGCINITDVILEEGTKRIEEKAFRDCIGINQLVVPSSIEYVAADAFPSEMYDTSSISGLVQLNGYIVSIANSVAILNLSSQQDVKGLLEGAASGNSSLTTINLGNHISAVRSHCFQNCTNLTSIQLGENIDKLEAYIFAGCSALQSIEIPNNILQIGRECFKDCTLLSTITFGTGLTKIGNAAFENCTALANSGDSVSLQLPGSLEEIGSTAFGNCTSLESINLGNRVTSISDDAFYECQNLKTITGGASLVDIGDRAFAYCNNLTSLPFGNACKSIGEGAFISCASLSVINLPSSVTFLGEMCFAQCSSLTSVSIGDRVEEIPSSCFVECSALEEIILGATVRTIGERAFEGITQVKEIIIPDKVVSIGGNAFSSNLQEASKIVSDSILEIGVMVDYIGDYAFRHAGNYENVIFRGNCPQNISSTAFGSLESASSLKRINVPKGSKGWERLQSIYPSLEIIYYPET